MATMYSRNVGAQRYAPNPTSPRNMDNEKNLNNKSSHNSVNFSQYQTRDEEERKKYLTAKYGQDQMKLIRKRLAVEDWVDKELKLLYDVESDSETYDCEIDLDELLDIDEIAAKRSFLLDKVSNARKSPAVINKFIDGVLEKAGTL